MDAERVRKFVCFRGLSLQLEMNRNVSLKLTPGVRTMFVLEKDTDDSPPELEPR